MTPSVYLQSHLFMHYIFNSRSFQEITEVGGRIMFYNKCIRFLKFYNIFIGFELKGFI